MGVAVVCYNMCQPVCIVCGPAPLQPPLEGGGEKEEQARKEETSHLPDPNVCTLVGLWTGFALDMRGG